MKNILALLLIYILIPSVASAGGFDAVTVSEGADGRSDIFSQPTDTGCYDNAVFVAGCIDDDDVFHTYNNCPGYT